MHVVEGNPFFSIIVPCCNVERYLGAMAASVKKQSFADWECVLSVEDSTDGTLAACEALAKGDQRFRIVRGPRSGSPSTPRNRGLSVAEGRYVVWLDGDDWLADDALAKMAKRLLANGEPDALQGSTTELLDDGKGGFTRVARHYNFEPDDDGKILSGLQVTQRFADLPRFAMPMASLTVCRHDFLLAHALQFVDGLRYEDNEWTPRVFAFAERVLVMDADVYVYRRRGGSITTADSLLSMYGQRADMLWHLFRFFVAHDFPAAFYRVWARRYVSFFFDQIFLDDLKEHRPGLAARDWTRCVRRVLSNGGRRAFLKLVRCAGLPKKLSAPLVLLCGIHPVLDVPARLYVRHVYYPLTMRRFKRRGW